MRVLGRENLLKKERERERERERESSLFPFLCFLHCKREREREREIQAFVKVNENTLAITSAFTKLPSPTSNFFFVLDFICELKSSCLPKTCQARVVLVPSCVCDDCTSCSLAWREFRIHMNKQSKLHRPGQPQRKRETIHFSFPFILHSLNEWECASIKCLTFLNGPLILVILFTLFPHLSPWLTPMTWGTFFCPKKQLAPLFSSPIYLQI